MPNVPATRLRVLRDHPVAVDGDFVLYWMTSNRRLEWSFALDRSVELAQEVGKPLVVLEALRADYPWASDRLHAFALDGMAEHARRLRGSPVVYYPYVEPQAGAGRGLLEALSARACSVVTDWDPAYFLPRMTTAAAKKVRARLEAVDSNGLLPLSIPDKAFGAAVHFRRFLQRRLPEHLLEMPSATPLESRELPRASLVRSGTENRPPGRDGAAHGGAGVDLTNLVGPSVVSRWAPAPDDLLSGSASALATLPIDHAVGRAPLRGGRASALALLDRFVDERLARYANERNDPDADAGSGLSPHLHWGHLSVHEVFRRVTEAEAWSPARISDRVDGRREGWWGMSPDAEAFLDQIVTWRELGFVYCERVPDYERFETLPAWAIDTLEAHADDPRPSTYDRDPFERAETHDELWNAAQRQLLREGIIHNYLRMLWGKKILEWSAHPREALDTMIDLNNRYSLDGRDPNSYSGIFWVLGRFDRGWPERPIFGKVRSMSSERTAAKVSVAGYLQRFGAGGA